MLLFSDQRAVTRLAPRNKAVCLRESFGSPKLERQIKITKLTKLHLFLSNKLTVNYSISSCFLLRFYP